MRIRLPNTRAAFVNVFQARAVNSGDEPRFSCSFIFPGPDLVVDYKEGDTWHKGASLRELIDRVGQEKWGAKWPQIKKELETKDRTCLHDGDGKAQYDGFEGNWYVSSSSKTRPDVRDADRTPLTPTDGRPYAGCYVTGIVDLWAQDNQYGKRINAGLAGIQFVRDGDAFSGGRPADEDDYDDVEVEVDGSDYV